MINHVVLMGRITQDLQVKYTQNGYPVLSFNVAVDKSYKQGEDRQADFITCVAWRNNAEFISKYFSKGRMIALEGSLSSRTYNDKSGVKHYVTEVLVSRVSFTGEPKKENNGYPDNSVNSNNGAYNNHTPQNADNQPIPFPDDVSIGDLSDYEEFINYDGLNY